MIVWEDWKRLIKLVLLMHLGAYYCIKMEYACAEKRRSKKDLRRKRRYRVYKKGGKWRAEGK